MAKPVEHKTLITIAGAVAPSLLKSGEQAKKIIGGVGEDVSAATGKLGKLRVGMLAAGAGLAAVGVAAGKAIWELGGQMQRLSRDLRLGTGATGENLEKLKSTALSAYGQIPISLEAAGQVVGNLNTHLGVTGVDLERLTKRVSALAHITGRDAGELSNQIGRIGTAFQLNTDELLKFSDVTRKLAEDSGIDHAQLTASIEKSGSALREMGYSANTSAALIAKMSKLGSGQSEKFFSGLRKGAQVIQKEFKGDLREGFAGIVEQIQTADEETARLVATQVFGAEAGAIFYEQIKAGALDAGVYAEQIAKSAQNTEALAKATMTSEERVALLQRSIGTKLMPIAEKLLGVFDETLSWWTGSNGESFLSGLGTAVELFWRIASPIGNILTAYQAISKYGPIVIDAVESWDARMRAFWSDLFGWIGELPGTLKTAAVEGISSLSSAISSGFENAFGRIKELAAPVLELIQPALELLGKTPQGRVFGALRTGLGALFGGSQDDAETLPKFASGGITTGPSIAGEAGPEYVIPLTGDRDQNLSHWLSAGELLGAGSSNSSTSISPVFSPTINVTVSQGNSGGSVADDIMKQIRAQGPAFIDYVLSELDLYRAGNFGGAL